MTEGKKPRDAGALVSRTYRLRLAATDRVSSLDPRAHAAWRTWLAALAKDAEAATAAALAYESLPAAGREAWLDALDIDAPNVNVPAVALYAPLLGVEQDVGRRERIALHVTGGATLRTPPQAMVGSCSVRAASSGSGSGLRVGAVEHVCFIVSPLYLDFVELLVCRYDPDQGIREARHEWLVHKSEVATSADELGVTLVDAPLPHVVEALAHAVVADQRAGREAPSALLACIDLFAPDLAPMTDACPPSGPSDVVGSLADE